MDPQYKRKLGNDHFLSDVTRHGKRVKCCFTLVWRATSAAVSIVSHVTGDKASAPLANSSFEMGMQTGYAQVNLKDEYDGID